MATVKKTRDEVQKIMEVYIKVFRDKRVKGKFALKIDEIFDPYLIFAMRMERSRTNAENYLRTLVKENPTPEETKLLNDETEILNKDFDEINRELVDVPEFLPKAEFLELIGEVYDISAQDLHFLYTYKTDPVTDEDVLWKFKKTEETPAVV